MKKIVLTFGLLSGAVMTILMLAVMVPMCLSGKSGGEVIGYSMMILSLILVFFGIRSYRDNISGGTITFGRGFRVGILITLITCAVYVITWEIVYYNFIPDFADRYAVLSIQKMRESGASASEIAKATQEMDRFKVLYKNPLYNVGMTFLEIFPVGLLMTLISAAILRKRTPTATAPAMA